MTQSTQRTIKVGSEELTYEARVEEFTIDGSDGQPGARIVCTTYQRSGIEQSGRPVIFAFNGGPGSSSVWLHLGMGPRRVSEADSLTPRSTPPYTLTDNSETVLDAADLVFIDPPGTGYSRVLSPELEADFYSTEGDARAFIRLISAWCRRHRRENSPRFLLGESYGSIRAAAIARLMPGGPMGTGSLGTTALSGVILLGAHFWKPDSDEVHAATLPTYAATAWYHDRLPNRPPTLEAHVESTRRFAEQDYLPALFAGTALAPERRTRIARSLHELIGIPADALISNHLRLSRAQFAQLLLADGDRQVGAYDTRYTLPIAGAGTDPVSDDPAMGQYAGMFSGALVPYLRDELGAEYDIDYRPIEFARVNFRWNHGSGPGVYPTSDTSIQDLAAAMRRDPRFTVLFCQGYYDLVTTVGALEHAVTRVPLDRDRVHIRRYESGHMPYLGGLAREQLADDIRKFLKAQENGS
ncbi:S10 family peptidase [Streptomyces sp. NPDC003247]|uniref:S10 family peptidase n=1 Tax=Streptomyces sp. NPDC003247 TaxID=3364677 RepID=UPI0036BF9BAE